MQAVHAIHAGTQAARWIWSLAGAAVLAIVLGGCAVQPFRPFTKLKHPGTACAAPETAEPTRTTPEVDATYTLHFVEFDDQGWTFGDDAPEAGTPSRQIDCAIRDLRDKLVGDPRDNLAKKSVLSFVYVHGWNHSADNDDRDVRKFRKLLSSRAALFPDRHIVGIYVAWQGNTLDVWGVRNLTFWGRKNAAHHVAEGRVRELFARIKGLREHWNGRGDFADRDCDWEPRGTDRCPLRTIMIGHSFGGLILYNSAAPYLIETLSQHRDLPDGERRPRSARAKGIADLIVLLNPAFEGSRYEAVFQASRSYRAESSEPPLLITLTSTADWATKKAFPVARWINSIFQYPASSEEQSNAMRNTHGHIKAYLTHTLCMADQACEAGLERIDAVVDGQSIASSRRFCGGMILRAHRPEEDWRSIVWNVRTDGRIIPNHNDIDRDEVLRFIAQIYSDVTGLNTDACDPEFFASRELEMAPPAAGPGPTAQVP